MSLASAECGVCGAEVLDIQYPPTIPIALIRTGLEPINYLIYILVGGYGLILLM